MKTRSVSLLLATTLGLITCLPLSASVEPAKAYRVSAVERFADHDLKPGDSMVTVLRLFSVPDQKLSDDTWVYRNFQPKWDEAVADGCDTLVISFAGGRVRDLMIVNRPAANLMAARLQPRQAPVRIAKN